MIFFFPFALRIYYDKLFSLLVLPAVKYAMIVERNHLLFAAWWKVKSKKENRKKSERCACVGDVKILSRIPADDGTSPWKTTLLRVLRTIFCPCCAHSGKRESRWLCWCVYVKQGVECRIIFGENSSLSLAQRFSRLRVSVRFRSVPHFFSPPVHIWSRKGIFFCTISVTESFQFFRVPHFPCDHEMRLKPEPWRETQKKRKLRVVKKKKKRRKTRIFSFSRFFGFRWFRLEEKKERKLENLFSYYPIHFLRTHQHKEAPCVWWRKKENKKGKFCVSAVNKANNNDTGTCFSSRCVIIITQKRQKVNLYAKED